MDVNDKGNGQCAIKQQSDQYILRKTITHREPISVACQYFISIQLPKANGGRFTGLRHEEGVLFTFQFF